MLTYMKIGLAILVVNTILTYAMVNTLYNYTGSDYKVRDRIREHYEWSAFIQVIIVVVLAFMIALMEYLYSIVVLPI